MAYTLKMNMKKLFKNKIIVGNKNYGKVLKTELRALLQKEG